MHDPVDCLRRPKSNGDPAGALFSRAPAEHVAEKWGRASGQTNAKGYHANFGGRSSIRHDGTCKLDKGHGGSPRGRTDDEQLDVPRFHASKSCSVSLFTNSEISIRGPPDSWRLEAERSAGLAWPGQAWQGLASGEPRERRGGGDRRARAAPVLLREPRRGRPQRVGTGTVSRVCRPPAAQGHSPARPRAWAPALLEEALAASHQEGGATRAKRRSSGDCEGGTQSATAAVVCVVRSSSASTAPPGAGAAHADPADGASEGDSAVRAEPAAGQGEGHSEAPLGGCSAAPLPFRVVPARRGERHCARGRVDGGLWRREVSSWWLRPIHSR